MVADTCYALNAVTRVYTWLYNGYGFIERTRGARVWERVISRHDRETLFLEIFLPRQVGGSRWGEKYCIIFLSTMLLDMHAYTRNGESGQWRREAMKIMRMGNIHYLISRIARISADSVMIITVDRTMNEVSSPEWLSIGTRNLSSIVTRHPTRNIIGDEITYAVVFSSRKPRIIEQRPFRQRSLKYRSFISRYMMNNECRDNRPLVSGEDEKRARLFNHIWAIYLKISLFKGIITISENL